MLSYPFPFRNALVRTSLLLPALVAVVVSDPAFAEDENLVEQGDDILAVVDLPLAAEMAADAGLSEQEVQETVEVAQESGMGAALINEVLVAEADAVKIRGKKTGFPDWVRARWAAGVRGVDLKKEIQGRPAQQKLNKEQRDELKSKLSKLRSERLSARKAQRKALQEQRKAGKKVKLRGKAQHDRLIGRAKGHPQAKEQAPSVGQDPSQATPSEAKQPSGPGKGLGTSKKSTKGARGEGKSASGTKKGRRSPKRKGKSKGKHR